MIISVDVLRELHRIHRQVGDLKSRLTRGPKLVEAGQLAVQRGEQNLAAAKELLKQARKESADQQLQLREREAKIVDVQRKLNECKTNIEFKTLKDQIDAEKQASSVLEDEILDKLEKIDQLQSHVHEAEQKLAKNREGLAKTQSRATGEHAGLQDELARVSQVLAQTEVQLPDEIRVEYDRIVKARGEEAMAPVDGECCGSCFTVLTAQTMNLLHLSRLVFCKSCGCLLYLPEEPHLG
jgi:predicted  nucleic acid-binding Zn-ribbon protein